MFEAVKRKAATAVANALLEKVFSFLGKSKKKKKKKKEKENVEGNYSHSIVILQHD